MLGWARPWGSLGLSDRGSDLVQLIGRDYAHPALAANFTRASAAEFVNPAGSLQTAAANVLRFFHDPTTLAPVGSQWEGQFPNTIRNPRAEGAVPGTPGTVPLFWSIQNGGGTNRQIVGAGVEDGIDFIDVRLNGASGAFSFHSFDTTRGAVGSGVSVLRTVYMRLIAGTIQNDALQLSGDFYNSGGTDLSGGAFQIIAPTSAPLRTQRFNRFQTSPANTATFTFGFRYLATAAFDLTLRIAMPNAGPAVYVGSPVRPPAAAPGAATRAPDTANIPLASIGMLNGYGVYLGRARTDLGAVASVRGLMQIDDGSGTNRVLVRQDSDRQPLSLYRVTGGAGTDFADAGTPTLGAEFGFALRYRPDGTCALSFNGAAPASHVGAPTSGLTRLVIGRSSEIVGGAPWGRWISELWRSPRDVSDAELRSLAA